MNSIESNGGRNKGSKNGGGAGETSEFKKLRIEISKLQREKEHFRMANEQVIYNYIYTKYLPIE